MSKELKRLPNREIRIFRYELSRKPYWVSEWDDKKQKEVMFSLHPVVKDIAESWASYATTEQMTAIHKALGIK